MVCDLEAETADELAARGRGLRRASSSPPAPARAAARSASAPSTSAGALKLIEACERTGVRRYLMVSAMGVDRPDAYPPEMEPYYEAKREADAALRESGLEHTIVRPGRLTDDPGTGLIEVGMPLDHGGEVTRDDVAATLLAVLDHPQTIGLTFDLLNGRDPIAEAVASLTPEPGG